MGHKSNGFGLGCARGHVIFRDGEFVCGRRGCECGVPAEQFVIELIRSGHLSLDNVFRAAGGRFDHACLPASMKRVVVLDERPQPLTIVDDDIAALERKLREHRAHEQQYLSEYVKYFVTLAPEHFGAVVKEQDWAILSGGSCGRSFLDWDVLMKLRPFNPTLVDEWLSALDAQVVAGLESARKGEFLMDTPEKDRPFRCALDVIWAASRIAKFTSVEKAMSLLTDEDKTAIDRALEWQLAQKSMWNNVRTLLALFVLDVERARNHTRAMWPRLKSHLLRWQRKTWQILKQFLEEGASTGNWDSYYFGDLRTVHTVCPELADEVSRPKDWLLLTAELEFWRGCRDDVYHIAHLRGMKEAEPAYVRFFTSTSSA